jgi:hypothetical protein
MAVRRNRYTSLCALIHLLAALRARAATGTLAIHDHKGGDSRFCHRTVLLSGVGAFAAGRDDHRISDQRGGVFKLAIIP